MSKNNKSTRKEQYIEKRKSLISLSQLVRPLVEEGEFNSINEALKEQYIEQNPNIKEFRTFGQWKQDGATVRKGESAHLIWGQPRRVEQAPEDSEEPEEFKYWPICYLFADTQVYKPEEKQEAKPEPQRAEQPEPVNGDDL